MLRFLRPCCLSLVLCLLAARGAQAAESFFLDLDTGGHRAFVRDLAFTPDGAFLVSASDDKTVRIWDWQTGVTVRTLRGAVGADQEGKVFSLAVSPDGRTVATGGWFDRGLGETPPYGDIRLFDFASGRVKGVLTGADYPVSALAFSPDGLWLAAGGQDGIVFLWTRDAAAPGGWTEKARLDAETGNVSRLAFLLGGRRLAATTADNGILLWSGDGASWTRTPMPEAEPWRDAVVRSLAASGDGKSFATGSDEGRVALWDAADGRLLGELPRQDFAVGALALAGGRIVVSCGYRCADRNRTTIWRLGDVTPTAEYRGHDGTVLASAASPDGTLVATAGGLHHAIHVWDPASGAARAVLQGRGSPVTAVGIDAASERIAWGTANPCPGEVACPATFGALETALRLPGRDRYFEHAAPAGPPQPFRRAALAQGSWSLAAREGGADNLANAVLVVSRDGAAVGEIENDATNGYLHAAFTLLGGGDRLITGGSDGTLLEYRSADAKFLGAFSGGHTGEIHALAASETLNLLVTGSADQTIRLWNLRTRELIVSMFFAGSDWIFWMPQGYYTASEGGDGMVGWHVNQGRDKEARFTRAAQLRSFLHSPEMVRRAIVLRSARAAVKEMRPGVENELDGLLGRRPPEFGLRVAPDQSRAPEGFVTLELTGAAPADLAGTDFAILSNSRAVGASLSRSVSGDGRTVTVNVPVEAGENSISVTGTDASGFLTERSVVALSKKARTEKKKGKLFVAAIGVDSYPFLGTACQGRSCDLRFPVDDAAAFLTTVAEKTAPMFSGMETLLLVNRDALDSEPDQARSVARVVGAEAIGEPDSDTIEDALEDFLDKPGPDDTTLVFVAGHGVNVDEDYYFVPTDARRSDGDKWKRSSLVDWAGIQKALERTEGTRVMLLDTCHAANAFNPRLEKEAANARIVVFSATAANNTAAELPELGHGVFTYSLLEGLKGKAGSGADGVRMLGLADFLDREVERLTAKRQKPFFYISNMENILLAGP